MSAPDEPFTLHQKLARRAAGSVKDHQRAAVAALVGDADQARIVRIYHVNIALPHAGDGVRPVITFRAMLQSFGQRGCSLVQPASLLTDECH